MVELGHSLAFRCTRRLCSSYNYTRRTSHIAYELGSKYWRQGIGGAAVCAMLKEITANCGVREFAATLKAANYCSYALLHSLGFGPTPSGQQFALDCELDEIVMYRTSEINEMQVRQKPSQHRDSR